MKSSFKNFTFLKLNINFNPSNNAKARTVNANEMYSC